MLSVCIPYHAGLSFLDTCLRSIAANPPASDYEIVVVEDASPEPSGKLLTRRYPEVRILVNNANVGFAASANRAVAECRGSELLILNPDTRVLPGALATLQQHLLEAPDVAAVGPMILNQDGTFQPQCKRGRLTPISALGYGLKLDRIASPGAPFGDYLRPWEPIDRRADVEALSGSCMLVRRDALEDVGGFDESLFLYGEDLDLCYRLRDRGWKVRYLPEARIVHVGGEGGTTIRYLHSLYHYHRSAYLVLRRNARGSAFDLYGWMFAAGLVVRFGLHAARRLTRPRPVGTRKAGGLDAPPLPDSRTANR